jgi:phosphomannomutase
LSDQSPLAPPGIFKAYDIRGLYGSEMDETTAEAIGRAFARVLGRLRGKRPSELRVGLGRDMRLTAPAMAAAVRDGLLAEGATVLDAGQVATEMLYHLVGSRELDGGAMVTASHNPKAYTGVKLVREGALPLSGDAGIGDVRAEIEAGLGDAPGGGSAEEVDVWDEFRAHALSFIDPANVRPMTVVVDGGNGMGGPMVGPILEKLPLELEEMYFVPDGEFPDHEPNPLLEENRRMIIDRVKSSGADLGIAWDGDADRCFFIDGTGAFVSGDFVTALLAEAFLIKHPGSTIIYDLRASHAVRDTVARYGGTSLMNRVGHAFFKRRMRETNAIFGGEVTGHYYFRDNFFADNGFIPALLILELMSRKGQTLHALLQPLSERYFISGEINTKLKSMDEVPARLVAIAAKYADGHQYELDGLSVEYPDWHFNVRPSNTEPLLRLNLEATTRELMEKRRDEVLAHIRA